MTPLQLSVQIFLSLYLSMKLLLLILLVLEAICSLVISVGRRAFLMHVLILRGRHLLVRVFFPLCHATLQATRISGIQTVKGFLLVFIIALSAGTVPT